MPTFLWREYFFLFFFAYCKPHNVHDPSNLSNLPIFKYNFGLNLTYFCRKWTTLANGHKFMHYCHKLVKTSKLGMMLGIGAQFACLAFACLGGFKMVCIPWTLLENKWNWNCRGCKIKPWIFSRMQNIRGLQLYS